MTISINSIIKNKYEIQRSDRDRVKRRTTARERRANRVKREAMRSEFNRKMEFEKYLRFCEDLDFEQKNGQLA
ncbi:hypothetical protein [Anaerococcus sp. Marseille-Q5996]|uniref:hypothetical protein n=1 Tax=Anaerococcus sp. Marseille-Q5996 TaxID=2972769 RepID=UPI0021C7BBF8|nr:hypothetical protein [Anaerococcus sp. Marseille-Q5996]